ncbi:SPL family radical SAM protein [Sandaracinus amylolyticus]|uniref:SPL family radical SAM protein n=1 Tax=Sandaracinus amylolyticus TaxID=927083 RepID=UPI001F3F1C50|nr:radical SAM protein [Sandaracinus amylolyticus]UJR84402.1 Hypothetical protein I5071_64810 [Sandaracinus amylolyticus]
MSDLRAQLVALLAPHSLGDEVVRGARFVNASTELGLRLTFELATPNAAPRIVHVEVAPRDEEARYAARTERFVLGYRTGTGSGGDHVAPHEGKALCDAIASVIARNEREVIASIARDAAAARESRDGSTRVREVHVSSLLESAEWHGTRYYTVSPYVGCLIGCRFCYAQTRVGMVRRLEGLPEVPWGSYVDARVNAPEVLARELASLPPGPIKFCPVVSDPYHAIEARLSLTRRCLDAIHDATRVFPTMVLTRSRLIERDAARLAALPVAYAGVSFPTIDDEVRRHFEPRGASIDDRLATLATLRAHGVRTFAVVQPMLPGSIDALADAIAAHATSASLDVLTSLEGAERDFADPRYTVARDPRWQVERAEAVSEALTARGVVLWRGELPPELCVDPL